MVCEQTGRKAFLMELNPLYCDRSTVETVYRREASALCVTFHFENVVYVGYAL